MGGECAIRKTDDGRILATAVDADYLIYNGTIDGQVSSLGDLEAKSNLFTEFKAVKDGNVWYTGKTYIRRQT